MGVVITLGHFDVIRGLVVGGILYAAGVIMATLVAFLERMREEGQETNRVWLARCVLRLSSLGLLYYVLDAVVHNWGTALHLRTIVALASIFAMPWALNELARDVLWDGTERRETT